jgi:hypothetical protein
MNYETPSSRAGAGAFGPSRACTTLTYSCGSLQVSSVSATHSGGETRVKMEKKSDTRYCVLTHYIYLCSQQIPKTGALAQLALISSWITRVRWCPGQRRIFRVLPCPALTRPDPAYLPCCRAVPQWMILMGTWKTPHNILHSCLD